MTDLTQIKEYRFPYTDLRFPGMFTGENILFVTRESEIIHKLRLVGLAIVCLLFLGLGLSLVNYLQNFILQIMVLKLPIIILSFTVFIGGLWWITQTFQKSVFIITTRRLTKIIYTTPFTWYQFSLGLDEIEDTGSYSSSYIEALFGLGYFVARSGAAAIKNFKIVNITFARDLHNYVNKLLYTFKHHSDKIHQFRPFIFGLKGEARENFIARYPQYQTEFD